MGDWKGVRVKPSGPIELYYLKTDIGETKDLAAANPDVVKRIGEIMRAAHIESPTKPGAKKPPPSA